MPQGPVAVGGGAAVHRILSEASVTAVLPEPLNAGSDVRGAAASPDDWVQADALADRPLHRQPLDAAAGLSQSCAAADSGSNAVASLALAADDKAGVRSSIDELGLPPSPSEPPAAPNGDGDFVIEANSVTFPRADGLPKARAMAAADSPDIPKAEEDVSSQLIASPAQPASVEGDARHTSAVHKHEYEGQEHEQEHADGSLAEAGQKPPGKRGVEQLSFDIRNCRALGSGLPHALAGASPPGQEAAIGRVLGADAASGAAVSNSPACCDRARVSSHEAACARPTGSHASAHLQTGCWMLRCRSRNILTILSGRLLRLVRIGDGKIPQ